MAPIGVGDSLPEGTLVWFDENDERQQVSVHSLAAGKKIVLFGVPGAFTPTCRYLIFPSDLLSGRCFRSDAFCFDRIN